MRRRFDFWHPSSGRLRAWLETGQPEGVGEHVEQCERCADRLEQLDRDGSDSGTPLRQALSELLGPPDDLSERVLHSVYARSRMNEEWALFAGLFAIGVETAQLMIDPGDGQDPSGGPSADGAEEEDETS